MRNLLLLAALALPSLLGARLAAVEKLTIKVDGAERAIAGKLLVEAEDGGVLVQTPDSRLWAVEPQNIVHRAQDAADFAPLSIDALEKQLSAELPGFRFHRTEHYLIAYQTSRAYAEWCGALYERLFRGFYDYWDDRGVTLSKPDMPLVAMIFADQKAYVAYGKPEVGEGIELIQGHYSLPANRVLLYDLTGMEGAGLGERQGLSARVNAILSRPGAEGTVATIIHEATHQLAFNSGMHQRLAAIPRWLSEGMAIYFETPNLKNARGWNRIGVVNRSRLQTFRQYLPQRPADSLTTLLTSDTRLMHSQTARAAYAEAWALNYFLIRNYQKQYAEYLKTLAKKGPLLPDDPDERLKDFQAAFGDDLGKLDAEFVKYMRKVK